MVSRKANQIGRLQAHHFLQLEGLQMGRSG
jgi:hypothetical protein